MSFRAAAAAVESPIHITGYTESMERFYFWFCTYNVVQKIVKRVNSAAH